MARNIFLVFQKARSLRSLTSGNQAQLLVVVEHRVHALDPNSVNGPVEEHPLVVRSVVLGARTDDLGDDSVPPLVRVSVELCILRRVNVNVRLVRVWCMYDKCLLRSLTSVKLAHGDGLGVEMVNLGLLELFVLDSRFF